LYNVYNTHFEFPYFGFNWDALRDSLCGLDEWIKEKIIVIIHKDLPHLGERDLMIYITVLYDVCELWEKYPDVLSFQVFFSKKDKGIIGKFLENIHSRFE
jgi:Barstar (barnase inhibitor).